MILTLSINRTNYTILELLVVTLRLYVLEDRQCTHIHRYTQRIT